MNKYKDLTKRRFGRLVALKRDTTKIKETLWICKCDCGKKKSILRSSLISKRTQSCGCLQKETTSLLAQNYLYKHGQCKTNKLYPKWLNMKSRCYSQKDLRYKNYGARGITVCDEWQHDFMSFYNWAVNHPTYKEGLTLDREDNNGPYAPWNCRFATVKEQNANTRRTVFIDIFKERLCLKEAVAKYGKVSYGTVKTRIKQNWNPVEAILTPAHQLSIHYHLA